MSQTPTHYLYPFLYIYSPSPILPILGMALNTSLTSYSLHSPYQDSKMCPMASQLQKSTDFIGIPEIPDKKTEVVLTLHDRPSQDVICPQKKINAERSLKANSSQDSIQRCSVPPHNSSLVQKNYLRTILRKNKKIRRTQLRFSWKNQRELRKEEKEYKGSTLRKKNENTPRASICWKMSQQAILQKREELLMRIRKNWEVVAPIQKISRQMAYLFSGK